MARKKKSKSVHFRIDDEELEKFRETADRYGGMSYVLRRFIWIFNRNHKKIAGGEMFLLDTGDDEPGDK